MVALCHCSLSSSDKASQHSFNIIWNRPVCCLLSIFDVFHQFVASLLVKSLILSQKRSRETTGFLFNHEEQCLILSGVWCLAFLVVIFLVEFLANMMSIRHHCKHGIRFAAHFFPFWDGNCAHLQLSLELYKKFLPTLSQPASQVTVVLWFRLSWLVCLVFFFFNFLQVVKHGGIDLFSLFFEDGIFGSHNGDRGSHHIWKREYVKARSSNLVGEE